MYNIFIYIYIYIYIYYIYIYTKAAKPVQDESAPENRRQALKDRTPLLPHGQHVDTGLLEQVESMMSTAASTGDEDLLLAQAKARLCYEVVGVPLK